MPRASRAEAERHREQVITATSKLVRTHGADKVSVPQAMAAAGLTHGGFYRHFASKDDLIAQACSAAFAERLAAMEEPPEGEDTVATRTAFLTGYLSARHRDNPALGCAAAALAVDAARAEPGDPLKEAFAEGIRNLIGGMRRNARRSDGGAADEESVLVELSTMLGALVLSRACAGDDLSDRILTAARDHVLGGHENTPDTKGSSGTDE
ncbi:TetR/AcrR family transcriptional regulator [Streptomyces malaysiensis subsp. malaysiensis]|uniref:TetR/AcrR family transcriptional regulator n=1 Tax=Streptomyces malaysiensis TaxID=92644 RepID=UPI000BFBC4F8|nr:TetR/AcrR family transcriptional regulator [Streptomyces malaysiensis]ATL87759.1 transcriptional regulator, TetR family [Streptomyces malaysiensis]QDL68871.1 TetR/AcrR family transcriptional regulator [Streptomyces malaysiensis]